MSATSKVQEQNSQQTCDGPQLADLARAGLAWLESNHEAVNQLNVFPVPDGDTGTNMLWTMRAACRDLGQMEEAGNVAATLAQGALMGARGNSGVILSQFWRGFAQGLDGASTMGAAELARALTGAEAVAYQAVAEPVEGTILTVIRAAARAAAHAAGQTGELQQALEHVLWQAQQTLAQTPEMLPVLKQAGVVDAGGQGLVFILEGMLRGMKGEMAIPMEMTAAATGPAQARAIPAGGRLPFPYDVQFLLQGARLDVAAVRRAIEAMGDSALVVGDPQTIKVHVHVTDPGIPLSYGVSLGEIEDVVVENMQSQMETAAGLSPASQIVPGQNGHGRPAAAAKMAVVAVADGPGLAQIFRDLGAAAIVPGGQSANPSTSEILDAIEATGSERVLVLPNNKNVIGAAEAAAGLSKRQVQVVPTRTVPQGVRAMFAFNGDGEPEAVAGAMRAAATTITSAAIATATRSVTLDGLSVRQGDQIATLDGRLCAASSTVGALLEQLLGQLDMSAYELLSLYYGAGVSETEAAALADQIRMAYPQSEVELLAGGQPHYHYLIGLE